jgi:hypothetical protein
MEIVRTLGAWRARRMARQDGRARLAPLEASTHVIAAAARVARADERRRHLPAWLRAQLALEAELEREAIEEQAVAAIFTRAGVTPRGPLVQLSGRRGWLLQVGMAVLESLMIAASLSYVLAPTEAGALALVTFLALPFVAKLAGIFIRQWPFRPVRDRIMALALLGVLLGTITGLAVLRELGLQAMAASTGDSNLPRHLAWLLTPLTALPILGSVLVGHCSEDEIPGLLAAVERRARSRRSARVAAADARVARERHDIEQELVGASEASITAEYARHALLVRAHVDLPLAKRAPLRPVESGPPWIRPHPDRLLEEA